MSTPKAKSAKAFAKWANAEFAPVPAEELARLEPPTNEEWDQMKNPYLFSLRLAYIVVQRDKAVHVGAVRDPQTAAELFNHLEACAERFRCFADLADEAIERLLCAGAKIKLESMEARS
jgi:hypothetical protein